MNVLTLLANYLMRLRRLNVCVWKETVSVNNSTSNKTLGKTIEKRLARNMRISLNSAIKMKL